MYVLRANQSSSSCTRRIPLEFAINDVPTQKQFYLFDIENQPYLQLLWLHREAIFANFYFFL